MSIINCKYKLLFVSFKSVEEVVKKPQKFTQRGCLMCAAILLRNAYKSGTLWRRACTSTQPHTTLCESHLRLLSCVAAWQSGQSTSYVARFPDFFSRFTYSGVLCCLTTLSNDATRHRRDATLRCKSLTKTKWRSVKLLAAQISRNQGKVWVSSKFRIPKSAPKFVRHGCTTYETQSLTCRLSAYNGRVLYTTRIRE